MGWPFTLQSTFRVFGYFGFKAHLQRKRKYINMHYSTAQSGALGPTAGVRVSAQPFIICVAWGPFASISSFVKWAHEIYVVTVT